MSRKGWVGQGTEYRRVLSQVPATLGTAKIAALAVIALMTTPASLAPT